MDYAVGDRVELVWTSDPYTRLRPGDHGTVKSVRRDLHDPRNDEIHVAWDSGSGLSMLPGHGDVIRPI